MNAVPDIKTGYGRPELRHDAALTEVRRGTPMGELLRRYWQVVGLSADAGDLPVRVRVLGEDLVLFRDRQGRPGLVEERCMHRGSSLFFGRIDAAGLRCCYHGWAFDVEGQCTDQPCEPDNGRLRRNLRQPWYPLEERYGLLFAYLGPPANKPLLPRYAALENLAPAEQLFTDDYNIGSGRYERGPVPFNWLQHYENIHDPGHFLWLHFFHSGAQFGSRYGELDKLDFQPWERLGDVRFRVTARGVANERTQTLPDGRQLRTVVETVQPNVRGVPNPFGKPGPIDNLGFILPVDDTQFRIFTVLRATNDRYFQIFRERRVQQLQQAAADPHYFQRYPGDWEAQGSQGAITQHSGEHLMSSDRGIVMLRRLLQRQIAELQGGKDPLNVAFAAGSEIIDLEAGQFLS